MSAGQFQAGTNYILYDAQILPAISLEWLQPQFWRIRRAVRADLGGRGQALVVDTAVGEAVLRRYLRGGQIARFFRDRYLFTGYERSRGLHEWRVLSRLFDAGLPVPRPLAASCERRGLFYQAGLLTELIPGAEPLSRLVEQMDDADWHRLARTLKAFFGAGVIHADLNAGNVVRDEAGEWYLVDFDRARIRAGAVAPDAMVKRLMRSLNKLGYPQATDRVARLFAARD